MGYFGSKEASGVYQAIIAQMPPHDTYIEMFLGGGAVMRHKPGCARTIGIEIDPCSAAAFDYGGDHELIVGDAVAIAAGFDYARAGRVLIYADPPYLLSTRTSTKRYRFDYCSAQDHIRLIEILKRVPASVMLSGYPSDLYDALLGGWRTITMQAMTRGGPRTEKVWMNFEAGPVHGCEFAGAGRTKRQHIKRKAARWRANYEKLSPGERLAVLSALLAAEARPSQPETATSPAV